MYKTFCRTLHRTALLIIQIRHRTAIFFPPFHEEHISFFLSERSRKRCRAGGESKIQEIKSQTQDLESKSSSCGLYIVNRKFSLFLKNIFSECELLPLLLQLNRLQNQVQALDNFIRHTNMINV